MPTLNDLIYGLLSTPNEGGLLATNRNNPFQNQNVMGGGLRAYKNKDGSWGGEMMPKYSGWQGLLYNSAYPGDVSTELSIGDNKGDFPSITPNTTQQQLATLLSLKHGQRMPDDVYHQAQDWANAMRALGKSPFKNAED